MNRRSWQKQQKIHQGNAPRRYRFNEFPPHYHVEPVTTDRHQLAVTAGETRWVTHLGVAAVDRDAQQSHPSGCCSHLLYPRTVLWPSRLTASASIPTAARGQRGTALVRS
jgi:hypothetical protein